MVPAIFKKRDKPVWGMGMMEDGEGKLGVGGKKYYLPFMTFKCGTILLALTGKCGLSHEGWCHACSSE
jgi:hypothetical protein